MKNNLTIIVSRLLTDLVKENRHFFAFFLGILGIKRDIVLKIAAVTFDIIV